jgi:hypothetical protein
LTLRAASCTMGCGAVSSAVRASGLHPEGRPFESDTAHQPSTIICGAVVQLVRTPACHAGGREFESRRPRQPFQSVGAICLPLLETLPLLSTMETPVNETSGRANSATGSSWVLPGRAGGDAGRAAHQDARSLQPELSVRLPGLPARERAARARRVIHDGRRDNAVAGNEEAQEPEIPGVINKRYFTGVNVGATLCGAGASR